MRQAITSTGQTVWADDYDPAIHGEIWCNGQADNGPCRAKVHHCARESKLKRPYFDCRPHAPGCNHHALPSEKDLVAAEDFAKRPPIGSETLVLTLTPPPSQPSGRGTRYSPLGDPARTQIHQVPSGEPIERTRHTGPHEFLHRLISGQFDLEWNLPRSPYPEDTDELRTLHEVAHHGNTVVHLGPEESAWFWGTVECPPTEAVDHPTMGWTFTGSPIGLRLSLTRSVLAYLDPQFPAHRSDLPTFHVLVYAKYAHASRAFGGPTLSVRRSSHVFAIA